GCTRSRAGRRCGSPARRQRCPARLPRRNGLGRVLQQLQPLANGAERILTAWERFILLQRQLLQPLLQGRQALAVSGKGGLLQGGALFGGQVIQGGGQIVRQLLGQ